jgi:hypothetical protein
MKLGDKALKLIARDILLGDETPAVENPTDDTAIKQRGASTSESKAPPLHSDNVLPFKSSTDV